MFVVLAQQNPANGFTLHGPFSTEAEAEDFACEIEDADAYVCILNEPKKDD